MGRMGGPEGNPDRTGARICGVAAISDRKAGTLAGGNRYKKSLLARVRRIEMSKLTCLSLAALAAVAVASLAPSSSEARTHHRYHRHHVNPLPYPISYLHNYGPGYLPGTFAFYDGPATTRCYQSAAAYLGQDGRRHPCY